MQGLSPVCNGVYFLNWAALFFTESKTDFKNRTQLKFKSNVLSKFCGLTVLKSSEYAKIWIFSNPGNYVIRQQHQPREV